MSFDSKKDIYGERLAHGVSIFVNACKYTVGGALEKRAIQIPVIPDFYTGPVAISGGDPLFFQNSKPYLKSTREIMKISVDSPTQITILERAQFGTPNIKHPYGEAFIVHGGEADGSCLGYPRTPSGGGCSNADSFERGAEREFLFIDGQSYDGQIYYNGLNSSMNHSPCEIKPGEAMAKSASYSFSIQDNTDDDVYSVPYPERRTSKSTLFRKLLARTGGYLQNRRVIVYTGFENNGNFDKGSCIAREYIIDSVQLNASNFSVKCLDPLMLAEETKAKMPAVSSGKLLNKIEETSTEIVMRDFIVDEYGVDDSSVVVNVDNEHIECTVTNSSTGLLTIVNRGIGNSEIKDHSVNATVQKVIVLENFNPVEFIIESLQEYTNLPPRFYGDYTSAIANTQPATGPVYIYKPDSVKKYIDNVIRAWSESNIALYFDERSQKIRVKAVGDFEQQPVTIDFSEDIKQESLSIKPDYKGQKTRATIGFAPYDAAKKVDDENSSIIFQSINIITEATGTLEPQEDAEFYTQFLTNSDTDIQIAVGGTARVANLNVEVPEVFTFKIDYSKYGPIEGGLIEEGEIINVTTDEVVNEDGTPRSSNLQILSLKDNPQEATYSVKAITYQDIINQADFDFVLDGNKENYDLSTEFAPTEPGEYVVFIPSGVTVGATTTDNPAFTTGTQANGVTLKIIVRGGILGAGGRGGDGVEASAANPQDFPMVAIAQGGDGLNGGNALELTVPTVLDVSQGVVYSGGGGAPATQSRADSINMTVRGGDGGSGAQGYVGGGFGLAGTAVIEGTAISDTGVNGIAGSRAAAGSLGVLSGGAFGQMSDSTTQSGSAGQAGYAILSNGNSVIIIGDNDLTIKGRRDF